MSTTIYSKNVSVDYATWVNLRASGNYLNPSTTGSGSFVLPHFIKYLNI